MNAPECMQNPLRRNTQFSFNKVVASKGLEEDERMYFCLIYLLWTIT